MLIRLLTYLFSFTELYAPIKEPLLPMHLFKITNFNMSVIVGTVGQMVFYALNILWPAQITSLYSTDNITIGLMSVSASLEHSNARTMMLY